MKVKSTKSEDAIIISLEGEMIFGHEDKDFFEAINSIPDTKQKRVIVDLSRVKLISSWGIGMLIHGYTSVTGSGGIFKLAAIPGNVENVLTITKLNTIFKQFSSVEEALTA
ncbi:MAG TPA: STAS domain-containing protein [Ignavibacteriaceae bacterium]|jgi:anti-sigma B factor antagonist